MGGAGVKKKEGRGKGKGLREVEGKGTPLTTPGD